MAVVQWPEELILSVMQIKQQPFYGAEDYQLVVLCVCMFIVHVVYVKKNEKQAGAELGQAQVPIGIGLYCD